MGTIRSTSKIGFFNFIIYVKYKKIIDRFLFKKIQKSLKSIKEKINVSQDEKSIDNNSTTTSTPAPFQNQFPQSIKILKRPPSDKKLNEMQQNQAQNK